MLEHGLGYRVAKWSEMGLWHGLFQGADIGEKVIVPSVMPSLSVTPGRIKHLGTKLGQNTDEVLSGLLGLEPQEIEELRKKRVI